MDAIDCRHRAHRNERHHDQQSERLFCGLRRWIVFGIGPLWSMFFNGLLLGVVGVACPQHGMSVDLWSFVAPHGSLELPSIILAGAAGLRLAQGVLFPGLYRWRDSVALAGIEATKLVSGIIPLLIIAGTLEGFFSPSNACGTGSSSRSADCFSRCCWCGCSGRCLRRPGGLRNFSRQLDIQGFHDCEFGLQRWFPSALKERYSCSRERPFYRRSPTFLGHVRPRPARAQRRRDRQFRTLRP